MISNLPSLRTTYLGCALFMLFTVGGLTSYAQDFSNVKGQKPFSMSGSMEGRGTMYRASGIADRRQPFSYLLNGSAAVSIYGLNIPFSISYSDVDRSFSQPFNQFGMSPTYKWITLHGGYRNIDYSPYTLGGHTMLGAGFELRPGKFRIGLMHGRLNRATAVDSTTQSLVPISFSRIGTAAKVGFGTDKSFIEFSALRAKDDSASLDRRMIRSEDFLSPASNYVMGYNFKLSFLKNFILESKGGASLYTRDINSILNFKSFNNQIIQKAQNITGFNGTTEVYGALDAALSYRAKNFGLKTEYKRVEPDYKTMGAYFFNSDLESWTFGPSFSAFKNKLRFTGSAGIWRDNLLGQKRSTNKRFIGSANASVEFNKALALDVVFSNFSNDQTPNILRFPDSLRVVQTTYNLTATPRYMIVSPDLVQVFSLSGSMNKLNDYNQVITTNQTVNRSIDTKQYFFSYVVSLPKKGTSLYLNLTRTDLRSELINNTYQGVTLGGNSNLFKNKLQVGLNSSFIHSKGEQGNSMILNGSGNVAYKVTKKQVLKTVLFLTANKPPTGGRQNGYIEVRNELSYLVNF